MLARTRQVLRDVVAWSRLSPSAKRAGLADRNGPSGADIGPVRAIEETVGWLCRAQDASSTRDGGVARHYSLLTGWGPSYPETTGYIIPTLLEQAWLRRDTRLVGRARRMLDWLVSIQLPSGAFAGGTVGQEPVKPVAFNTGQVLLGLVAGVEAFGEPYREAMNRAAAWLVAAQDRDGAWSRYQSPFASAGAKTYDTHIAWALLEAARLAPAAPYAHVALRDVEWALARRRPNGWLPDCCLSDPQRPFTHTLGYALRGLVEAYLFTRDGALLDASTLMATGIAGALRADGFLPGRLDADWNPAADWACLTGTSQIAHAWLQLYEETGDERFHDAGCAANRFVRRTIDLGDNPAVRGGVKGSFPVSGGYGPYQYLSWAAKFTADSNALEQSLAVDDQ